MPNPFECPATTTGMDGRPNRCALTANHEGPHRNRSGRIKWMDDGNESVRTFSHVNDRAHKQFGTQEAQHND